MEWRWPWGSAEKVAVENSTTFEQKFGFGALKLGFVWAYQELKGAGFGAAKLTGAVSGSLEWFSSGTRLGPLARHGGWALYMVDASGVFLFGDWWPTIGVSGVILFSVLVVALVAYALSVVSKPLGFEVGLRVGLPGAQGCRIWGSQTYRCSQRKLGVVLIRNTSWTACSARRLGPLHGGCVGRVPLWRLVANDRSQRRYPFLSVGGGVGGLRSLGGEQTSQVDGSILGMDWLASAPWRC